MKKTTSHFQGQQFTHISNVSKVDTEFLTVRGYIINCAFIKVSFAGEYFCNQICLLGEAFATMMLGKFIPCVLFAKGILSLLGSWCKVPLSKRKMAFHELIKSDRSISNQVNCDPIHIDTFRNGPFHNTVDVIFFCGASKQSSNALKGCSFACCSQL